MSCGIDGGTPPPAGNAWNTTPEPSINDSYIRSVFATLEEAACTFELVVYGTKPDMYNQSVYMRKRDTLSPGSCQEPKGWFYTPRVSDHDREKAGALLVRHPSQANMLLYAFSGRSINWFLEAGVFLIDSVTGRQLHPGKLRASAEPHWGQRWTPLAAEFPGCDLVVHWKGIVNGATGTNTGFVRSEHVHFIAPRVQPSALPDVLVYE